MGPVSERPDRIPDYSRFIVTGVVLGAMAGLVVGALRDEAGDKVPLVQQALYTALLLGFLGALAGGLVAILFDRGAGRRG